MPKTAEVTFGRKQVFSTKPVRFSHFKPLVFMPKPKLKPKPELGVGEKRGSMRNRFGIKCHFPLLGKKSEILGKKIIPHKI